MILILLIVVIAIVLGIPVAFVWALCRAAASDASYDDEARR